MWRCRWEMMEQVAADANGDGLAGQVVRFTVMVYLERSRFNAGSLKASQPLSILSW
jgi:hypothetical protein